MTNGKVCWPDIRLCGVEPLVRGKEEGARFGDYK